MPKHSLQWDSCWHYLTVSWRDKGVHSFPKGISPKVAVTDRLEFKPTALNFKSKLYNILHNPANLHTWDRSETSSPLSTERGSLQFFFSSCHKALNYECYFWHYDYIQRVSCRIRRYSVNGIFFRIFCHEFKVCIIWNWFIPTKKKKNSNNELTDRSKSW